MQSRRTILGLLVVSALCLATSMATVQAGTTITVTTPDDELNSDGDCSLREAIQAANTDSAVSGCPAGNGADTIVVPAGVYSLTMYQLTILSELTISGAGSHNTFIDGDSNHQVFDAVSPITATISSVTIQHGYEPGGGGGGIHNGGKLLLVNTTVTSNTAGYGGGIHNQEGTLTLINCTVSHNEANNAAGVENDYGGTVTLINSTVSSNQSGYNGGGFVNDASTLILINSTVSGNSATVAGGGIYTHGDSPVALIGSTIVSNTAGFAGGGGITYGGPINIKNTIIAGNTKAGGNPSDCSATLTSQGYNLVQDVTDCTITGDTTGNQTAVDPNVGPLGDNGGPTLTHALLPGSPAIDAGNPAGCTDHVDSPLTSDQRGFPRAVDGDDNGSAICDIGAYELWEPSHWIYLPLTVR